MTTAPDFSWWDCVTADFFGQMRSCCDLLEREAGHQMRFWVNVYPRRKDNSTAIEVIGTTHRGRASAFRGGGKLGDAYAKIAMSIGGGPPQLGEPAEWDERTAVDVRAIEPHYIAEYLRLESEGFFD